MASVVHGGSACEHHLKAEGGGKIGDAVGSHGKLHKRRTQTPENGSSKTAKKNLEYLTHCWLFRSENFGRPPIYQTSSALLYTLCK